MGRKALLGSNVKLIDVGPGSHIHEEMVWIGLVALL